MPRISDVHRDSYTDSILSLSEGLIILFVASSVLVLGALCKYLGKLCRKLWKKPRWKRKSKKRHSKRAEQRKGSAPVKRSGSFRSGEGVVMSPQFTIPSSRSCMIQQPYPDLSQGRTGKTTADKRLSLVSFYLKEKEIGKLNPQLYQNYERTVRIGMDKELGQLNLILKYKGKTRNLSVTLVSGKDFPPRDFSGTIDTCVTVCVLPHRERRKRTAIHRRSMNPLYNENFVFNIQLGEDTHAHSLLLITYFYDSFSHAHVLGQCYVPLIYCDFSSETIVWCYLDHPYGSYTTLVAALQSLVTSECGDLLLSLCYVSKSQTLTVAIMKGMNLAEGRLSSVEKLYTKATLLHDNQKIGKRKTSLQEIGDIYTVFNEALLFRIPGEKLISCTLKISVNHYNVMGKSSSLGEVTFSAESTGLEDAHWSSVTTKRDKPVAMWHTLRGFKFMETSREEREPLSPN